MHATLLLEEGRTDEASALIDEVAGLRFSDYYHVLDFGMALAALGRGEELKASLDNDDIGEGWRAAGGALAMGDFGAAAAAYAELGLRPYEARARLHAAARLVGEGRRREADEHLGGALAFYRTVGATRYIREGEGLLAASA